MSRATRELTPQPPHTPSLPSASFSTPSRSDPPPEPADANGSLALLSDPVRTATLRARRLTPDRRNEHKVVDRLANACGFEFSSIENACRKLLENAKNLLRVFPNPSLVEACLLSQFQLAMSRLVQHFEYLALADVVPLDRDELRAYATAQRDFFRAAQALQRRLDYRQRATNHTRAARFPLQTRFTRPRVLQTQFTRPRVACRFTTFDRPHRDPECNHDPLRIDTPERRPRPADSSLRRKPGLPCLE